MTFLKNFIFLFLFFCFLTQNVLSNELIKRMNCVFDKDFQSSDCDWVVSSNINITDQGLVLYGSFLLADTKIKFYPVLSSKILHASELKYANDWILKIKAFSDISDNLKLKWRITNVEDEVIGNIGSVTVNNLVDWTDYNKANFDLHQPFKIILQAQFKNLRKTDATKELKVFSVGFNNYHIDFTAYKDCYINCLGKCINEEKVCDTVNNCDNGIDEINCGPTDNFFWINSDVNKWLIVDKTAILDFRNSDQEKSLLESFVFRPISTGHRNKDSDSYDKCKLRFQYCSPSLYSNFSITLTELKSITTEKEEMEHYTYDQEYLKDKFLRHHKIYEKIGSNLLGCQNYEEIAKVPQSMRGNFFIQIHASHFDHPDKDSNVSSLKFTNMFFTKQCFDGDFRESRWDYYTYANKLYLPRLKGEEVLIHSCNSNGPKKPDKDQCKKYYKDDKSIEVLDNGVQVYTVPKTAFYTVFITGGKGGNSGSNKLGGYSPVVRGSFYLKEGEKLKFIIGQKGEDSCNLESEKNKDYFCHQHRAAAGGGGTFVFSEEDGKRRLLLASGGGSGSDIDEFYEYDSGNGLFFDTFTKYYNKDMNKLGLGKSWYSEKLGNFFNKTENEFFDNLLNSDKDFFNECPENVSKVKGGFGGGSNSCGKYSGAGGGYKGGFSSIEKGSTGGVSYFDRSKVFFPVFGLNVITQRNYSTLTRNFSPNSNKLNLENNGFALIYIRDDNCVLLSDHTTLCRDGYSALFWAFVFIMIILLSFVFVYYCYNSNFLMNCGNCLFYLRRNEQRIRSHLQRNSEGSSVRTAELRVEGLGHEMDLLRRSGERDSPEVPQPSCSTDEPSDNSPSDDSGLTNVTKLSAIKKHEVEEKLIDVQEKLGSGIEVPK